MTALTDPREATYYQDTGCPAAPSCLTCPFAVCVEDTKPGKGRTKRIMALGVSFKDATKIMRGSVVWT